MTGRIPAPQHEAVEDEFRDEYNRRILSPVLGALLIASGVVLLVALFGPWLRPGTLYSFSLSCVVLVFLIWLNKKGKTSVAGVLAILTMICVANYGLWIDRGFRDESMLIFPGVIILCTGFSDDVNEQNAQSYGISKFLLKPVSRSDLEAALSDILN